MPVAGRGPAGEGRELLRASHLHDDVDNVRQVIGVDCVGEHHQITGIAH